MDVRRLASLLVVALFVLPLLAPLIAAVPVSAQVTPLRVTNFVITAGGELGFILNRTVLIVGHPVQGAPVLYFWASKNPDTTLVGDEFLLATLAVGTTPGVIFGTLLVNETIGGWFGVGAGNIYLKVTSSRATGAAAVVSDAFTLLVDTAAIERALKVLHAPTDSPRRDFAYYTFFGRSNYPEFVLNLSAIGIGLGVGKTLERADAVNFTLIKGTQELYASNGTKAEAKDKTNFLRSPKNFGKQAGDAPHNVVRLNGTITDFALLFPTDLTTVNATITVAYQAFKLIATVKNDSTKILNVAYAKIDKSRIIIINASTPVTGIIFNHTVASIGWTQTVNIYPTARFAFIDSDGNGFINVRDRVQIEFRNFKDGTYTPRVAFFARLPDFTYVELPVKNTTVSVTISSGTNTSLFEVAIPDNPYGGRLILATVNVSAGWALAGPTPGSVRPTIAVWGFRNDGTLIVPAPSGNFTAGEYIFVRGRGFLVETPTLDLMNGTVRIPLTVVASTGVFGNGSFGAIFQIPPGIALYHGNSVTLRVYTGDPATTTNIATITRTVTFDTDVINVFIEPRPRIISIFPPSARVDLGATKFPSPATWEPEATRKFTLLVYGFFATALRFNISLVSPPAAIPVALNVPRTGVGSLLATFDVPEAPFGSYQVEVRTLGVGFRTSDSAVQRMLNVSVTAAAVDPADGVAKKRVFLPVAVNLTIKGVSFKAGEAVRFDIPQIGVSNAPLLSGPRTLPTPVSTTDKGSFEGWIDLPALITAPGTYSIRIHQSPEEVEILVTIGVPPPFTVRVVTGAAKFADLPLDIWVLAFYGGSLASETQVTSVSLSVYLRVGTVTTIFTLTPTPAVPGQAIFHAIFDTPPEALGRDLLILATVKARFSPIAPEDTASDVTSVAIPPVRITDMLEQILEDVVAGKTTLDNIITQLTTISTKLDGLEAALGSAVTAIRGDISVVKSDIAGVRALVLQVNTNISQAILVVSGQNNAILDKLDKMNATLISVSGGVAKLSTDVDGLATLIRSANLSISKVVVDQAGRVIAALSDSEGRIVGAISTLSTDVDGLATLIRAAIAAGAEAFDRVMTQLTAISGKLDTLSTALETAVTTIRGDIAAAEGRIRGDIAGVRALVLEVNTNVGFVAQAVLTVKDQNDAILARLGDIDAKLTGVSGGVAKLSTDVDGLATLIRSANLSISKVVVDQAGRVIAALSDSEGRIVGAISTLSTDVDGLATLIRAAIAAGAEAFDRVMTQLTAISGKLDTLSTALETAVTTIRGDIAAAEGRIRGDIAGVRALVLEVNTNVGFVAQAVLTVADQNKAVLDRLDKINATLVGVSGGVAKLSTDVDGLATLIRAANLSISKVVVDQAGRVIAALSDSEGRISGLITTLSTDVAGLASLVKAANLSISQIVVDQAGRVIAALSDSEGRIVGAISTNAKTLSDLITAVGKDVAGVAASVKTLSDTLATFQSGAFSKLDAIAGSVDTVKADLARLRTDAAAMASVVAGIQTTVSRIDTNVGGLVDTAKAITTTVDSINKAVPGLATKDDVSGAQTAITGAVDKAKSDLQSAVKSAEDTASTSSRNWGVINTILIIIAIAVLAYSTFVARRA